jgi:hypothetical protein
MWVAHSMERLHHHYLWLEMASNILPAATAGALFGAALAAAGVYSPATIIGQMRLQDFHMLKVFLTATGSST